MSRTTGDGLCHTQDQHPGIWDHRAPTVARRPALSERNLMTATPASTVVTVSDALATCQ